MGPPPGPPPPPLKTNYRDATRGIPSQQQQRVKERSPQVVGPQQDNYWGEQPPKQRTVLGKEDIYRGSVARDQDAPAFDRYDVGAQQRAAKVQKAAAAQFRYEQPLKGENIANDNRGDSPSSRRNYQPSSSSDTTKNEANYRYGGIMDSEERRRPTEEPMNYNRDGRGNSERRPEESRYREERSPSSSSREAESYNNGVRRSAEEPTNYNRERESRGGSERRPQEYRYREDRSSSSSREDESYRSGVRRPEEPTNYRNDESRGNSERRPAEDATYRSSPNREDKPYNGGGGASRGTSRSFEIELDDDRYPASRNNERYPPPQYGPSNGAYNMPQQPYDEFERDNYFMSNDFVYWDRDFSDSEYNDQERRSGIPRRRLASNDPRRVNDAVDVEAYPPPLTPKEKAEQEELRREEKKQAIIQKLLDDAIEFLNRDDRAVQILGTDIVLLDNETITEKESMSAANRMVTGGNGLQGGGSKISYTLPVMGSEGVGKVDVVTIHYAAMAGIQQMTLDAGGYRFNVRLKKAPTDNGSTNNGRMQEPTFHRPSLTRPEQGNAQDPIAGIVIEGPERPVNHVQQEYDYDGNEYVDLKSKDPVKKAPREVKTTAVSRDPVMEVPPPTSDDNNDDLQEIPQTPGVPQTPQNLQFVRPSLQRGGGDSQTTGVVISGEVDEDEELD